MNIAVFASGNGTNFQAIARAVRSGSIRARLALLVSDNPAAYAIERARRLGIKALVVRREDFFRSEDFEEAISRRLKKEKIGLIVLAGFMRLLSPRFVRAHKNRIVNIHPALLPSFKGTKSIKDAFEYGVKVTGVTVHFVDEKMDHGPIILQQAVPVRPRDTLRALEARIHNAEHRLYPQAIRLFVEGRLKIRGRKVLVTAP